MNYRSKRMLAAANGGSCINCGLSDTTVVAAHYQGLRSHSLGKGTGIKPHDICVADLCAKCHRQFDQYLNFTSTGESPYMRKIDMSEQFLFCIVQTILRRIDQGVITISDLKGPT